MKLFYILTIITCTSSEKIHYVLKYPIKQYQPINEEQVPISSTETNQDSSGATYQAITKHLSGTASTTTAEILNSIKSPHSSSSLTFTKTSNDEDVISQNDVIIKSLPHNYVRNSPLQNFNLDNYVIYESDVENTTSDSPSYLTKSNVPRILLRASTSSNTSPNSPDRNIVKAFGYQPFYTPSNGNIKSFYKVNSYSPFIIRSIKKSSQNNVKSDSNYNIISYNNSGVPTYRKLFYPNLNENSLITKPTETVPVYYYQSSGSNLEKIMEQRKPIFVPTLSTILPTKLSPISSTLPPIFVPELHTSVVPKTYNNNAYLEPVQKNNPYFKYTTHQQSHENVDYITTSVPSYVSTEYSTILPPSSTFESVNTPKPPTYVSKPYTEHAYLQPDHGVKLVYFK